jgi:cell division protein FtsZ
MLIKPDLKKAAKIKLVGVGGAGCNAINTTLASDKLEGVECIAVNTDAQALLSNKAETKLQIGDKVTRGLGAGGNPEIGKEAAEESREKIKEYLEGADLVFLTAGMGGGTGTGASPLIAEVAKENGALTIAVVTKPFMFEGTKRALNASEGIQKLKDKVDALITIPNQKVLELSDRKLSLLDAFAEVDSVLQQGVKGLTEIITLPGLVNVDFADVKTIMQNAGTAIMGIGIGSGERRALQAVKQTMSSPLLEYSIDGAKGILFNIVGGNNLSMQEVSDAAEIITKNADPNAQIIFGAAIDPTLNEEIKITLIATRFDESKLKTQDLGKIEVSKAEPKSDDNLSELEIPAFLRKKIG